MSRLSIKNLTQVEAALDGIYNYMDSHLIVNPRDTCPIDIAFAFLKIYMTQSCGKCTPCRVGLRQVSLLLEKVLNNEATMETLDEIEQLATNITNSADCAIGTEAGKMVLKSLDGFREDFISHITTGNCLAERTDSIPCIANCPAHINIPGYIALINNEKYEDAVRLITRDNPLPCVCSLICEHPCETRCRRTLLDAPINIRALKRAACDRAGVVKAPERMDDTGKKVAVVGGGPSGLTVAFFLQYMGHQVTIFERHKQLGGMLIYGIPAYRLPRKYLQTDIDQILSLGIDVKLNTEVGVGDYTIEKLREEYDAVYISIGAHKAKNLRIDGEDSEGVISAVDLLGQLGDDEPIDFTGKKVVIVGGGNVAMDCTRSAIRLGAESVSIVYRRRREDMTALPEEIEGAIAEGANLLELYAPKSIEVKDGKCVALLATPNMVSSIKNGKMSPIPSGSDDIRIEADIIIKAIGQEMDLSGFADTEIPLEHGLVKAADWTSIEGIPGLFAGGDCVTGPKTAIAAIGAGKVAAANIDEYLGYNHIIPYDIDIPEVYLRDRKYCGRIDPKERPANERIKDFELMEIGFNDKETEQESSRCLRCDRNNCGIMKGGSIGW